MKNIFLILLFTFSLSTVFGQTIDSVVVSRCIGIDDGDTIYSIGVDSFDVNDLLINSYGYDTNWIANSRVLNLYSPSHMLLYTTTQYSDSGVWTTISEESTQYDTGDSLLDDVYYHYLYNLGLITDTFGYRNTFLRDSVNHEVTHFLFSFNDQTQAWDTGSATISIYDSLNRVAIAMHESPGISGYLEVQDSNTYYYLANDSLNYYLRYSFANALVTNRYQCIYNLQSYLMQFADSTINFSTQSFYLGSLRQYYRDTSNRIIAFSMHYSIDFNGTLDPCGDTTAYQYNTFDEQTYQVTEYCGGGGNYGTMLYDNNGILMHKDNCSYGSMGDQHCYQCDYTFSTAPFTTGVPSSVNNSPSPVILFPNPARDNFTLKNSSPEKSTVEIVNLFGEVIFTKNVSGKSESAIEANLSAGIYLVRVRTGDRTFVMKMTIE